MKRVFDIIVSLALAFPALVLIAAAGLVIKLTSPGPVIFRQLRVGKDEKLFTCLKLRTMDVGTRNAPSHELARSAVTPVGGWLRRLKLDELPQLWNILRGEMSLVGPRPCLPSQVELIEARRERGLSGLRPGVTGVSQIRGIDMSNPQRLAASDATYLQDMSLGQDVKIILQTVAGAGRGDALK